MPRPSCAAALPLLASWLLAGGCRAATPTPSAMRASFSLGQDPFAIAAGVDALGDVDLWPGFDPRAVPLAIFDGERTLLFGHPVPPEGFAPVPGHPGVFALRGRHPAVTANGSANIAGHPTATVLMSGPIAMPAGLIGIAVHEKFHVFQRARHPGWSGNEVELFTYPFADAAALALRRLETQALRGALAARDGASVACWSGLATALRRDRFAALRAGAVEWERRSELNEGLARYVEHRAMGYDDVHVIPAEDFPPEELRWRVYRSGAAMARLLDRLNPHWRDSLERRDTTAKAATPLDSLLDEAARRATLTTNVRVPCGFEPETRAAAVRTAARDVESLRERLAQERESALGRSGWRIVFVAPGEPLFPQEFDPLNVRVVSPGEVVHSRFLRLGNKGGTIEVLDATALTEAAGAHPLFNGVRAVTVTGLAHEPIIATENGVLTVRAKGLSAELRGAVLTSRDGRNVVLLAP
jgi:hypothetical protein